MTDPLALDVTDIARSRAFYAAALAPLGYTVVAEERDGAAGTLAEQLHAVPLGEPGFQAASPLFRGSGWIGRDLSARGLDIRTLDRHSG